MKDAIAKLYQFYKDMACVFTKSGKLTLRDELALAARIGGAVKLDSIGVSYAIADEILKQKERK